MIKTRIVSALIAVSFILVSPMAMAGVSETLLSNGLKLVPDSVLKKLIYELSPTDAKRLEKKLVGLHSQCSQLRSQQSRNRREELRGTFGKGVLRKRFKKLKVKPVAATRIVTGEEMAKVKNDHVNALKRVAELQGYLKRVSQEIHSFLIWWVGTEDYRKGKGLKASLPELHQTRYAFIHKSYNHLDYRLGLSDSSFVLLMKNLVYLMDGRLQRSLVSLKSSISNQKYNSCKKTLKRFGNE